jgi:glycine/D-amino acid oxidase-like deaminating enzyme
VACPAPGRDPGYDVAVVGAGAAGCEAALRLARGGREVLLATTSLDTVFAAPVERVPQEALGVGLGAELRARLPAAPDGTVASWELHAAAKYRLEATRRLHLLQSSVDALLVEDGVVTGVETWEGVPRRARRVALCVGAFLRARLTVGVATERAGRPGEMAYDELADDLAARGVRLVEASARGGGDGRPAWTLSFLRIAGDEREGTRLPRLPGLHAAGACVHGDLRYDEAASEGAALAAAIEEDLADGAAPGAQPSSVS